MHFFEQLSELRAKRPVPSILTVRSENCDYCPYHANGKNSYRIIGHNLSEDCYYGLWVGVSRDCVDNAFIEKCELCYECVDCRESYNCMYCPVLLPPFGRDLSTSAAQFFFAWYTSFHTAPSSIG